MRISEAFPSNYLKAADLQGRNINVTIDRVVYEEIGQDRKPILYFEGKEKGIVLNKTNAQTIVMAYGDDTTDWKGGEIVIFPTMVSFQSQQVEAIRVRIPPRKPIANRARVPSGPSSDGDPRDKELANTAPVDDDVPF